MIDRVAAMVSTIVPVRNRAALVVEAVGSVLAQTYRPIEIIVVDDGSTDETARICDQLAAEHPAEVRCLHQPPSGVAAARNAGIAVARGEYVQFLDSDDLLEPAKFARQVAGLQAHPECGISYCKTREYRIDQPWSGRPARRTGERMTQLFPHLLGGRVWAAPSPLYRRDVVDANGTMLLISKYEDWEYEARAAARHVRLHYCDEFLADKRDVHTLEGTRKGATAQHQWAEYAEAHRTVLRHARTAGVAPLELDRFAPRLLFAARRCASNGNAADARSLAILAGDCAVGLPHRLGVAGYLAASRILGFAAVGHALDALDQLPLLMRARDAQRRADGWLPLWRHRATEARKTIAGRPVLTWPHLLAARWAGRVRTP